MIMVSIPQLIKKGDRSVLLGMHKTPPAVDCRVWAEDNYQEVIDMLSEIRQYDIESYVNSGTALLPHHLRQRIQKFLELNDRKFKVRITE